VARNVAYVDDPVSPLQQLDVFGFVPTKGCEPAPVVVWVHGGGWAIGDKRNGIADKVELFNGLGYVLVSVNYRLSTPEGAADRPIHPAHAEDVGAAVAWVQDNIAGYGGDGEEIALLGHSAGGHLVSLVGTDPQYVDDAGGSADAVRCVISNDTEGYDLVERAALATSRRLLANAFGPDQSTYAAASPINHVGDRDEPADFLVITRGTPRRVAAANAFATAAEGAGSSVDVLEARGLTHADVNRLVGADGDTVITPAITTFLEGCLDLQ
jgi:acetyl esterase/lipase